MTQHNSLVWSILLGVMLSFYVTSAEGQTKPYYGPLLYSMHGDTAVPPVYVGQPPQVTTGYLWIDDVMRLYPETKIDSFFNSLSWGDTMKTLASVFYQAQDDNPLSFYNWSGKLLKPNPYKGDIGRVQLQFEHRMGIALDTGRTYALLTADIISDVFIVDTNCVKDPPNSAFDMVFVNSMILDEIKGKKVPLCVGEGMRAHRNNKGATAQSTGTIPWATYPVSADSGTCLQFEYSPAWHRISGLDYPGPNLIDSLGGWWVKPAHEYIVFLNFMGISHDSVNGYFTLWPSGAAPVNAASGCMYPVVSGIVQDPYDDFGLGGANLSVSLWKARLRARIDKIIHP